MGKKILCGWMKVYGEWYYYEKATTNFSYWAIYIDEKKRYSIVVVDTSPYRTDGEFVRTRVSSTNLEKVKALALMLI